MIQNNTHFYFFSANDLEENIFIDLEIVKTVMGFKQEVDREKLFNLASERSDRKVGSWNDFEELPTRNKQDLLENSETDVLFESDQKFLGGQTTSGTSGRMAAVMKTERDYEKEKSHNDKRLSEFFNQDSRVLILIRSAWGHGLLRDLRRKNIFGKIASPYHLDQAVEIIENMGINSLFTSPSYALQIGRRLDKKERQRFSSLALGGSGLSKPAKDELENLFPQAQIFQTYGATESGSIAFQDDKIAGTNKYIVDTDHHYVEILNEDDKPVEEGKEGEITVTNLWEKSGIPLLRYTTGDRGILINEGDRTILKVLGRMKFDSVKVGGIEIYSENFENAMQEVSELLKPEYQIIVDENSDGEKAKPYLTVKASPRTGFTKDKLVSARTKHMLMDNFKITSDKSWKDLVEKEVFAEIELDLVKDSYFEGKKPDIIDKRN